LTSPIAGVASASDAAASAKMRFIRSVPGIPLVV
jgi:hypothetical protein